jgi:hypothetical protein
MDISEALARIAATQEKAVEDHRQAVIAAKSSAMVTDVIIAALIHSLALQGALDVREFVRQVNTAARLKSASDLPANDSHEAQDEIKAVFDAQIGLRVISFLALANTVDPQPLS